MTFISKDKNIIHININLSFFVTIFKLLIIGLILHTIIAYPLLSIIPVFYSLYLRSITKESNEALELLKKYSKDVN
jgi:hypothetical protein